MKTDALNAGIEAEIVYAAGNSEFIHIRQIPVKDYPKGFSLVENEAALASFLVSGPPPAGSAKREAGRKRTAKSLRLMGKA